MGAVYSNAYTIIGLQNDIEYTFGVRVEDQSANEDGNTNTATSTPTGTTVIFLDDFNDGNSDGWTVVVDSPGRTADWQVINGEYNQLNDVKGFQDSFHLGTFSYYDNGFGLSNYQVQVEILPDLNEDDSRDTVGLIFRYVDNDNYYRFSMSRFQGFARLERKSNGVFSTLKVDGRGFDRDQALNVSIDLDGSKIFVIVNSSPLFSVADSSHATGTIALYTMSEAKFDNVKILESDTDPKVVISEPIANFVDITDTELANDILNVSALTRNYPVGGGVEFILDNINSSGQIYGEPFDCQFTNVSEGNHTIEALIIDDLGDQVTGLLAKDINQNVGVGGKVFVAFGDSITQGVGDDISNDDSSQEGNNKSRGFTPILNDLLTNCLQQPIVVANEGLGGTRSFDGAYRLDSTKDRFPNAEYWLILFGTNDAGATLFTPSGVNCTEADFQAGEPSCQGTYKEYMRSIVLNLKNDEKVPMLAKVPFSSTAIADVDQRIQEYNTSIDQLELEHSIQVIPPDFYTYFSNNTLELADDGVHLDGQGYISMADRWFEALTDPQQGIFLCQ